MHRAPAHLLSVAEVEWRHDPDRDRGEDDEHVFHGAGEYTLATARRCATLGDPVKSLGEALREITAAFGPREAVTRELLDARGLVLAEDIHADADLPRFDDSAMDGYAFRHADVPHAGAGLPVRGESAAGNLPSPLAPGHAMRIFTGAPLPEGADTVVIQENTERDGSRVTILDVPRLGANVRRRGSDVRAGALVLASGTPLGPGEIGFCAALDRVSVRVHRPPRVAIVRTGDELRPVGSPAVPGSIVDSNAFALAAQLAEVGAEPWALDPAPDRVEAIAERLEAALSADCVLTVGGVSVGEHDHVHAALERVGVEVRFRKVAIKPGKPLLFGIRAGVPVVGLPGNPASAMVTCEIFVKPGLRRMLGHARPYPVFTDAVLAHAYTHSRGRTGLARARLLHEQGRIVARLHAQQGSGAMSSMAAVDALVVLSPERERFEAGETVHVIELGSPRLQAESPFG